MNGKYDSTFAQPEPIDPERLRLPESARKEFIEGEWNEEITAELLSTVGFNVFSWTTEASAVTDRLAVDHAIPYEGIAYVRRLAGSTENVEVFMREGYYKTYHSIFGSDAERFWEWYTK